MKKIELDIIFDLVVCFLVFSLSISQALPNIFLALATLIIFFRKKKKNKIPKAYLIILILFFLFTVTKALIYNSFLQNIEEYKHLLVLIISSVLIFKVKDIYLIVRGYVYGIVSIVLFTYGKIVVFYLKHNNLPFDNSSEIHNLLSIHRPYLGFMCFSAIVLIFFLINNVDSISIKKRIHFILGILIFSFLYLIVARLSLILAIGYIICRIILTLRLSKTKIISSFFFVTLLALFFLLSNNNFKKRFHVQGSISQTVDTFIDYEPRFVIWHCSLNQFKQKDFSFLLGYNNRAQIIENLISCYQESIQKKSKREYYLKSKFNTHNQLIDIFLDGGLISLSLFLLLIFIACYSLKNNFDIFFLIGGLLLFLFIENLFHRQLGVFLFGILVPLLFRISNIKKNKIYTK